MVHVVTAQDRAHFSEALAQMHRDRKRVFVDRLGWKLSVVDGEYEIDQFDTDQAVYLLALDSDGVHQGSLRLLPTTVPHLMSEVFPHLCERGVPRGADVWEISRLVYSPDARDLAATRHRLKTAVIEFGLLYGITRYSCATHVQFLSAMMTGGWCFEPLGLPQPDPSGVMVGAVQISISPEALLAMRANTGLRTPVLRWETRDAA